MSETLTDAEFLREIVRCAYVGDPRVAADAERLLAIADRLATPASAPVGERTDGQRFFWLGMHLAGTKWADALESLRPRDAEGDYTEKYIGGPDSLRAAIDAARAAERRDQEEGR